MNVDSILTCPFLPVRSRLYSLSYYPPCNIQQDTMISMLSSGMTPSYTFKKQHVFEFTSICI